MQETFIVNCAPRTAQGKGASRRLRKTGQVPAIIYGGHVAPENVQIDGFEIAHHLDSEAFYSHILTLKLASGETQAVLKDVQRHPVKPVILHVDFQRVLANEAIRMHVPLHFINEGGCPARKAGGVVEHLSNEVEVSCLPGLLPEFIEVDCATLDIGGSIHLSTLPLPDGVTLVALQHGDDAAVVAAHKTRAAAGGEGDEAAAAAE